jgi:prepilin-type N-terminal cleavage/methylation domain-containing protein
MSRRGLTLLELLIALSLLVALGAIAFPAVMRQFDGRAFDAAADVAVNHLLLARAHAQSSRQPVEVIYVPQPAHLEARLFEPALAEVDDIVIAEPIDPEADDASTAFAFEFDAEDEERLAIAAGWAWRALPDGVELSRRPPDEEEMEKEDLYDDLVMEFEEEMEAWEEASDEPTTFRIAVFLPDGSALIGEDAWLRGADGRIGRLSVNPFTGLPVFERLEEVEPVVEDEPEEQEEEGLEEEAYEAEDELEPAPTDPEPADSGGSDDEETPE